MPKVHSQSHDGTVGQHCGHPVDDILLAEVRGKLVVVFNIGHQEGVLARFVEVLRQRLVPVFRRRISERHDVIGEVSAKSGFHASVLPLNDAVLNKESRK